MRTPAVLLAACASAAVLVSCGKPREPDRKPADRPRVLATVNGVPITEADVEARARGSVKAGMPDHEASANVLQTVVREEIEAQKAKELGLDAEPAFRARFDELEAELRSLKRQQLGLLLRTWTQGQAAPTEAEARAWFEKNEAFVRTRFHVLQIMSRSGDAEIAKARDEVRAGTPFETAAAARFPAAPAGARPPWDLGEMAWNQMPPAWRGVVDRLEPGQVSDVIHGESGRSWLVKLAGKTVDPRIDFSSEKDRIVETLRQQRARESYDRMLEETKAKADVVYSR